ncbi:MAG TPA: M23 family metallopeptidase [Patescibacteria group bacterium]|nr:M23 family metallopeptidase [Patescibacteria group bacterium]
MKRFIRLVMIVGVMVFGSLVSVSYAATTLCRLPLAANPGYYAWFDHNDAVGAKKRYDCSTTFSYDNHHGTDFATSMGTSVLAGASGSLYYRVDGCPDGSQPSCGGYYGNHVRISHPLDSHVTIYAHLQNGTVVWPQSILCGGFVGRSGNSGLSSTPHLHFERWRTTSIGARLDFYGGSCNSPSYWVNQNGDWPTTQCQ